MLETCPACGQALPADGGALGNLLRAQRLKLKFTLRDVERISGGKISNGYLSQLETGKIKDPAMSTVLHLSAALCLDLEDIFSAIDPSYIRRSTIPGDAHGR